MYSVSEIGPAGATGIFRDSGRALGDVGISPSAPPAALEAAARDRIRTLGFKSGGTNVLADYGSVRVDGLA